MAVTDPETEKQRLAKAYAGMADEELSELGAEEDALSDIAREALRQELARRQLELPPQQPPAQEPTPPDESLPVTIRRFLNLPEALLAKGGLDSAGIRCFLLDDNMIRLDGFISNGAEGIRLQVEERDAEAALRILDAPIPDHFTVEGVGDFRQPRCPKCGSLDISYGELDKNVAYTTAVMGLPLPRHRAWGWCQSCGYRWEPAEEHPSADH